MVTTCVKVKGDGLRDDVFFSKRAYIEGTLPPQLLMPLHLSLYLGTNPMVNFEPFMSFDNREYFGNIVRSCLVSKRFEDGFLAEEVVEGRWQGSC